MKRLLLVVLAPLLVSASANLPEVSVTEMLILTYESHSLVIAETHNCADAVYPESFGSWCVYGTFDPFLFVAALSMTKWQATSTHWVVYENGLWGLELVHPSGLELLVYVDYEVNLSMWIMVEPGTGLPPGGTIGPN